MFFQTADSINQQPAVLIPNSISGKLNPRNLAETLTLIRVITRHTQQEVLKRIILKVIKIAFSLLIGKDRRKSKNKTTQMLGHSLILNP
jgi:hypothetical protein